MSNKIKKSVAEKVFIGFWCAFFCFFSLFFVYCGYFLIVNMFNDPQAFLTNPFALPESWSFENIKAAFSMTVKGYNFMGMFSNSMLQILISMGCALTFSPMTGYIFARYNFKAKNIILTILIVTATVPMIGAGAVVYKLAVKLNMLNNYLWLIIMQSGSLGFGTIVYMNYFGGLNKELMEAAALDGAGRLRIYFQIMYPQAWPLLSCQVVLNAIANWNDYGTTYLYMTERPTVAYGLQELNVSLVKYGSNYPALFAITFISAAFGLILYLIFSKKISENMITSGIKG